MLRDALVGMAFTTGLALVVKVLAFYGIHPVAPLDVWCYATAFIVGILAVPMKETK